ncbi:MAG: hypothetical protein MRY83_13695 [Flavobacteriales bacterium]|nr:hypothetical protein [Flavobacteriales bacterium]
MNLKTIALAICCLFVFNSFANKDKLIKVETDQESGIITYELKEDIAGHIAIFDQLGRLIFKQKVAYAKGEIDLSFLEETGYFEFVFETKLTTEKEIIELI